MIVYSVFSIHTFVRNVKHREDSKARKVNYYYYILGLKQSLVDAKTS